MKSPALNHPLVVVIGDVHHHIGLAVEGLERIEVETGRPIAQIFSVGDFGLFLKVADWNFLTGPVKYRSPESSPQIRAAWSAWHWPLSMIGGNHEPFHLLRDWDPAAFSDKLQYTDVGELRHSIPGLRVAGLSGIHHPEQMDFITEGERNLPRTHHADSWPEMVELVRAGLISRKRLTYYKQREIHQLCHLDFTPHLVLLHDWPVAPPHIGEIQGCRPEAEILNALKPRFLCCGHHHTSAKFNVGTSEVIALNLITTKELSYHRKIQTGWAALFDWDGKSLQFLQIWPAP
jgi:hypothetical protein